MRVGFGLQRSYNNTHILNRKRQWSNNNVIQAVELSRTGLSSSFVSLLRYVTSLASNAHWDPRIRGLCSGFIAKAKYNKSMAILCYTHEKTHTILCTLLIVKSLIYNGMKVADLKKLGRRWKYNVLHSLLYNIFKDRNCLVLFILSSLAKDCPKKRQSWWIN